MNAPDTTQGVATLAPVALLPAVTAARPSGRCKRGVDVASGWKPAGKARKGRDSLLALCAA